MTHFSKIGFIMATAGSAIGLGAIWKFPYMAGMNGGGAFVIIFFIAFVVIGLSIFLIEMILGRAGRSNPYTSLKHIAPHNAKGMRYGGIMMISGLLIFSFYAVVMGWLFHYLYLSFTHLPKTLEEARSVLGNFLGQQIGWQAFWHLLVVLLCGWILQRGVKDGIEKLNLILMPLLFLIFMGLLIYSIQFDSFGQSVYFLFYPNWDKITAEVVISAIGQAFFTLSLGVGTILTYSASLPQKGNFVHSALWVAIMNFIFCLVAGLVVFTFIFGFGAEPNAGPGLVFVSLPLIFSQMGEIGQIIAILFFIALIFAGITSAVSMLEPSISFCIVELKMKRKTANWLVVLLVYVVGLLVLIGGADAFREQMSFFGKTFFEWIDFFTSAIMMPLAGIFLCFFAGYVLSKSEVYGMFEGCLQGWIFKVWYFIIRYIAPLAILIAMIDLIIQAFYGTQQSIIYHVLSYISAIVQNIFK